MKLTNNQNIDLDHLSLFIKGKVMLKNSLKYCFDSAPDELDCSVTFNGNPDTYWSTRNISIEIKPRDDNESASSAMRIKYQALRTKKRKNNVPPRAIIF